MLASFQQEGTFTPLDPVVVGGFDTVSRQIVLAAGQNLLRGSVLGKSSIGAPSSAVKASGANTGNGTLTLDPTAAEQANVKAGLYTVRFAGERGCTVRLRLDAAPDGGDLLRDQPVPAVAAPAAGVAATGGITVSAAATAPGTISLYFAGQNVSVAANGTDTPAQIAAKIVAAINVLTSLPSSRPWTAPTLRRST